LPVVVVVDDVLLHHHTHPRFILRPCQVHFDSIRRGTSQGTAGGRRKRKTQLENCIKCVSYNLGIEICGLGGRHLLGRLHEGFPVA
jgi:hypothetical protein